MPFFSIVIPCYNKQEYIKETLQSVLNQNYNDFEVIVVDDGSTDNSMKILTSLNDVRIKIIKQKNKGVSAARNKGIKAARGEFIAFLDADDFWEAFHLSTIYNMIKKFPDCGMYCSAYDRFINGKKKPCHYNDIPFKDKKIYLIDDYFKKSTLGNNIAWTSSVVVPKNVLLKVGGFPEGISRGEDRYVWGVIAITYKVAFYNYPTAFYRIINTGLTSGKDFNTHWIFEDYINSLKPGEINSEQLESIRVYLLERKLNFVIPLFKDRQYKKALKLLKESYKYKKLRQKVVSIIFRILLRR